ncbi:MAG: hypothetical protein H6607_13355 [Flavobacteriales bacterium]|nr:hypothetical protein [Flavobacteriales bacterium]
MKSFLIVLQICVFKLFALAQDIQSFHIQLALYYRYSGIEEEFIYIKDSIGAHYLHKTPSIQKDSAIILYSKPFFTNSYKAPLNAWVFNFVKEMDSLSRLDIISIDIDSNLISKIDTNNILLSADKSQLCFLFDSLKFEKNFVFMFYHPNLCISINTFNGADSTQFYRCFHELVFNQYSLKEWVILYKMNKKYPIFRYIPEFKGLLTNEELLGIVENVSYKTD